MTFDYGVLSFRIPDITEKLKLHQYDLVIVFRILVYEYVNNGNLEQWLHGEVGPVSPLTWEIRMNIVLGTAKGYFHNPSI